MDIKIKHQSIHLQGDDKVDIEIYAQYVDKDRYTFGCITKLEVFSGQTPMIAVSVDGEEIQEFLITEKGLIKREMV